MAKKLVKRKPRFYLGLFILVFFIASILFGIVRSSISGGTTLFAWSIWGGGLALYCGILLRYLEWTHVGGGKFKKPLRICSWVAFSLMVFFLLIGAF
ncbi:MAG TPA: hypothetical protein VF374_03790 [Thermoplasmata archaeon]|jgi:uncharacterized membrane protein YidH (DUF202 family)